MQTRFPQPVCCERRAPPPDLAERRPLPRGRRCVFSPPGEWRAAGCVRRSEVGARLRGWRRRCRRARSDEGFGETRHSFAVPADVVGDGREFRRRAFERGSHAETLPAGRNDRNDPESWASASVPFTCVIPVRDDLRALEGYHSAQVDVRVRLNTNESPTPPPDAFRDAVAAEVSRVEWHRYPDRAARRCARPSLRATAWICAGLRRERIQRGTPDDPVGLCGPGPRRGDV